MNNTKPVLTLEDRLAIAKAKDDELDNSYREKAKAFDDELSKMFHEFVRSDHQDVNFGRLGQVRFAYDYTTDIPIPIIELKIRDYFNEQLCRAENKVLAYPLIVSVTILTMRILTMEDKICVAVNF